MNNTLAKILFIGLGVDVVSTYSGSLADISARRLIAYCEEHGLSLSITLSCGLTHGQIRYEDGVCTHAWYNTLTGDAAKAEVDRMLAGRFLVTSSAAFQWGAATTVAANA